MEYGSKEVTEIIKNFSNGKQWLNDLVIEIVGGENEVSPLVLLRSYDQKPELDMLVPLATEFIMNKEVRFTRKGQLLHSFVYNGGDLSASFAKVPYLLDPLLKLCYGLMLKKLTPLSEDSETEEVQ